MASSISISMNSILTEGRPEEALQFPLGKLGYWVGRIGCVRSCAGESEPAHIVDMKRMKDPFQQGKSGFETRSSAASVLYPSRDTP